MSERSKAYYFSKEELKMISHALTQHLEVVSDNGDEHAKYLELRNDVNMCIDGTL